MQSTDGSSNGDEHLLDWKGKKRAFVPNSIKFAFHIAKGIKIGD